MRLTLALCLIFYSSQVQAGLQCKINSKKAIQDFVDSSEAITLETPIAEIEKARAAALAKAANADAADTVTITVPIKKKTPSKRPAKRSRPPAKDRPPTYFARPKNLKELGIRKDDFVVFKSKNDRYAGNLVRETDSEYIIKTQDGSTVGLKKSRITGIENPTLADIRVPPTHAEYTSKPKPSPSALQLGTHRGRELSAGEKITVAGNQEGSFVGRRSGIGQFAGTTHNGRTAKSLDSGGANHDSVSVSSGPDGSLTFLSGDGVGSHRLGGEASGLAVTEGADQASKGGDIVQVFESAAARLHKEADSVPYSQSERLFTTLTGARVRPREVSGSKSASGVNEYDYEIGNAGDSRTVLLSEDNVKFKTKEDTRAQEVFESNPSLLGVDPGDAPLNYPERNQILNGLGLRRYRQPFDNVVYVKKGVAKTGDRFISASDYVWDNITPEDVAKLTENATSPEEIVEIVSAEVRRRIREEGGKEDHFNIVAVLLD